MDSYKRCNGNLQNAKKENHMLLSGENVVLNSLLKPRYMEFSTKFVTHIQRKLYNNDNFHTLTSITCLQ
jgi:hypothetical protein